MLSYAGLILWNMSTPQINKTWDHQAAAFEIWGLLAHSLSRTVLLFSGTRRRHWVSYFYFWLAVEYWHRYLLNSKIYWMYNTDSAWFCNESPTPRVFPAGKNINGHPTWNALDMEAQKSPLYYFIKWYVNKFVAWYTYLKMGNRFDLVFGAAYFLAS